MIRAVRQRNRTRLLGRETLVIRVLLIRARDLLSLVCYWAMPYTLTLATNRENNKCTSLTS
jgi:hypothetical protein